MSRLVKRLVGIALRAYARRYGVAAALALLADLVAPAGETA